MNCSKSRITEQSGASFVLDEKRIYLTLAASKIFCTAAEISGPMPSPGMRVHLCTVLLYNRAPAIFEEIY